MPLTVSGGNSIQFIHWITLLHIRIYYNTIRKVIRSTSPWTRWCAADNVDVRLRLRTVVQRVVVAIRAERPSIWAMVPVYNIRYKHINFVVDSRATVLFYERHRQDQENHRSNNIQIYKEIINITCPSRKLSSPPTDDIKTGRTLVHNGL